MGSIVRTNKANQFFMMLPHQSHRFDKIAVVRNNDGTFVSVKPCVMKKVNGQIYV